jgi:hypothetical protein
MGIYKVLNRPQYLIQNQINPIPDIIIGKPDNFISLLSQPCCPSGIIFPLGRFQMCRAINLNAKFCFCTVKINNKPVNRMLAAKLIAQTPVSQPRPERSFCRRLRLSQFPRSLQNWRVNPMSFMHINSAYLYCQYTPESLPGICSQTLPDVCTQGLPPVCSRSLPLSVTIS